MHPRHEPTDHLPSPDHAAHGARRGAGDHLPSPSGKEAGGEGVILPSPSGRGAGGEGNLTAATPTIANAGTGSPLPNPLPEGEGDGTFRFDVFRYDAARSEPPRFQTYELEIGASGTPGRQTSVLEGLLRIQDEQDPSLAFRSSCRGAVCGSCGMSINGRLNLACRVQLHRLARRRVVLEPLPGLEVIKDLVVDMDPFWAKYERIQPWLHAEIAAAEGNRMTEPQRQRIDQFVNCILCGLCYAACPVTKTDERFTGPAALAKLYRFLADSRENRDGSDAEARRLAGGRVGLPHDHEVRRGLPQGSPPHRRHSRAAAEAPLAAAQTVLWERPP